MSALIRSLASFAIVPRNQDAGWCWLKLKICIVKQVVVVIGNSLSGQDISIELVDVAKEVHLSAKTLDISNGLSKVLSKNSSLHIHPQVPFLFMSMPPHTILGKWSLSSNGICSNGQVPLVMGKQEKIQEGLFPYKGIRLRFPHPAAHSRIFLTFLTCPYLMSYLYVWIACMGKCIWVVISKTHLAQVTN